MSTAPTVTLTSKYGDVVVRFLGAVDSIAPLAIVHAHAPGYVTVNRVQYAVGYLRLRDYGQGFEPERDKHGNTFNALYATRPDRFSEPASSPARSKLFAELPAVVRAYVAEHPEVLDAAERARLDLAIDKVSADLADLNAKVKEKVAELQALLARREAFPKAEA